MRQKRELNAAEYGFNVALLLLGLFSTWYIFFKLFEFPYITPMVGYVCLCGAVFACVFLLGKFSPKLAWLLGGLILIIWLMVGRHIYDPALVESPQVFIRYIVPNLNRLVYYEFPAQPESTLREQRNLAFFCMYLLAPYSGLLSYGVLVRKSRIMISILTIPVFAFAYALQGLPSTAMLVMIFLFWIVVIIKPKHHTGEFKLSHITVAGSVALSGLFLVALLAIFPPEGFVAHPKTDEVRQSIIDLGVRIGENGFLNGIFGFSSGAPLTSSDSEVNLNNAGSIRFTDRDIMQVYMDEPQTIYLRGYSAAVYDGNAWSQLEDGALSSTGIPDDSMQYLGTYGNDIIWRESTRITVETLTSSSNYTFTPYLLSSMEPSLQFINDAYYPSGDVQSGVFASMGSENLGGAEAEIGQVCEIIQSSPDIDYFTEQYQNLSDFQNLRTGLYFASKGAAYEGDVIGIYAYDYLYGSNVGGTWYYELRSLSDDLSSDFILDDNYSAADSQYIRSVKNLYTQLPDNLQNQLLTWWLEQKGCTAEDEYYEAHLAFLKDTPYWLWPEVAYEVAQAVQNSGEYTKSPGRQPINRDFVEYFLNERNKGYCVHYASATVTLLRAMGIPARYVEGYVVGKSLFNSSGVALVPSENAHAWAEFWMPGIGWVPLESTPGGASPVIYGQGLAASTETIEVTPTPAPAESTPESEESQPAIEDDMEVGQREQNTAETTEGDTDLFQTYWPIAVILAVGLLILLLWLGNNLWRRIWKRRFVNPDSNRAALYIYAFIEKLCRFGCEMPQEAQRIAMKAQFSAHKIEEFELERMRGDMETCKENLRKSQPAWKVWLLKLWGLSS